MIKTNSDNLIELESLEISDLISVDALNKYQGSLASGLGCAITVINKNGKPLTECSNFCKYCEYYVRSSREGADKCEKSHRIFGSEADRLGRVYISKCHAGLTEFAVPLVIDGEYLGSVVGGQYVTEKYKVKEIKEIAEDIGANSDNLLTALDEMPRVDKKYIETITSVISTSFMSMLKEGYLREQLKLISQNLSGEVSEVSETLGGVLKTAETIKGRQKELNASVSDVEEASVKIEDVLKSISQLADQTKILSFNAQIEAVRAGAVGKSFTVVAGEIKELADTSKNTAENISDLTSQIKSSVRTTVKCSDETLEAAMEQSYAMDSAKDSVDEIITLAAQLSSIINKK